MKQAKGYITAPRGFAASGICCGIKKGVKDLALIYSQKPAVAAGTFTTNRFCAAPVILSRERLKRGRIRAIVVNSGCANAATGEMGLRDAAEVTRAAAKVLGVQEVAVLPASTGRIGKRLPVDRIRKGIRVLAAKLSRRGGRDAAIAILTTDTRPKEVCVRARIGGKSVTIAGMAKGSGMIHPKMATMLAFIVTDAAIQAGILRRMLAASVDRSFNLVTVDGDRSTNDSVFVLANGCAGNRPVSIENSRDGRIFARALDRVTVALAEEIARDGEGASKLIRIVVRGARDREESRTLGFAVANSPLFKTAMYGEEPNWGRILSAIGASGVPVDPRRVVVRLQGICVFKNGTPAPCAEKTLDRRMKNKEILVEIAVGRGKSEERILTCDFTPDYVHLNKT